MAEIVKYQSGTAVQRAPSIIEKSRVDRIHTEAVGDYAASDGRIQASPSKVPPELAARIYHSSIAVNSLIRIGADAFKQLPLDVMLREANSRRSKPRFDTETYALLNWVNPHMTQIELMEGTYSWLKLAGEAFWVVEPTEPKYARFSSLSIYPLNPAFVEIIPDPETNRRAYVYTVGGESIWLDDQQVLHFKNFNPTDYWRGHADLSTLATDISIEHHGKRQISNYYSRATNISAVITSEQDLGESEVKRLKRDFNAQYAGAKNSYRLVVLEKGMTYEPLKSNGSDQFLSQIMDGTKENFGMILGVPLGYATGKTVAGTTLVDLAALMYESNIVPTAMAVAQTITKRMAMIENRRLYCEFNFQNVRALRLGDLDRTRTETAAVLAGTVTPNEVRIGRNAEPYSGDNAEFGDTPTPLFNVNKAAESAEAAAIGSPDASASLPLPGSQGGRDQSATGEAQMADSTGQRMIDAAPRDPAALRKYILGLLEG